MKKSLGSLGALAAMCAASGSSEAAVMTAGSVNNEVIVSTSTDMYDYINVGFDLDGDSDNDLHFYSNSGFVQLESTGSTQTYYQVLSPGSFQAMSVNVGATVDLSMDSYQYPYLHDTGSPGLSVLTPGTHYVGFIFESGSGYLHTGYMELEVTIDGSNGGLWDKSGDSLTLVSARWETVDNSAITVVPEPSTTLLSLSGLAGLMFLRRRS